MAELNLKALLEEAKVDEAQIVVADQAVAATKKAVAEVQKAEGVFQKNTKDFQDAEE
jgi:hypothetical protein